MRIITNRRLLQTNTISQTFAERALHCSLETASKILDLANKHSDNPEAFVRAYRLEASPIK
jgi:hypothetical protein